jgi:hypothetical protein
MESLSITVAVSTALLSAETYNVCTVGHVHCVLLLCHCALASE